VVRPSKLSSLYLSKELARCKHVLDSNQDYVLIVVRVNERLSSV
jgi:hypothetical protein